MTPHRLPPLNALRVFHAVMRQRSFRGAADELSVSPQAVSQQVRLLEQSLGVTLFHRRGRAVEPTEPALMLGHFVQAGFAEFDEGVRRVTRIGSRERINVNASPYFATRYLIDRIAGFRALLPGADLRLTTQVELPDFAADEVDVAIQWGFGRWKGHEQVLLLRDPKVICCAPALAARLAAPADLAELPLLHLVLAPGLWPDILRHLGVEAHDRSADLRLQDAATMRQATLAGLGVGLISAIDAAEDLAAGRLVAPFGTEVMQTMPAEQVPGFYLLLPGAHRRVKAIAAFCRLVEAEDWQAPPR